ncbi:hypothetical protein LEP1GSC185_1387 [Leptospira licerasiae serovar Varillal str. VAR 010]|uniref:Ig-like protein n=2 Tax=Leptospira licerasiae TaxID=447106 RepID=A0ABP2RIT3_9LEPT|nr:hypothetical protein LEP1GSC185_1387 [Leptospira licerasiae serovar Varillal str. VAR 010]EJZ43367.1 Ig-like protein [Leptospira licerasiae str. MMD4847]
MKFNFLRKSIYGLSIFFLISCDQLTGSADKMFPFLGGSENPKLVYSYPLKDTANIPPNATISFLFDKEMNIDSCISAFVIDPKTTGFFASNPFGFEFTPSAPLSDGTYTITITKSCEAKSGLDLDNVFVLRFAVGSIPGGNQLSPTVVSSSTLHGTPATCNAGSGASINFFTNTVEDGCVGTVASRTPIQIVFSAPMDRTITTLALSYTAGLAASISWSSDSQTLTILPDGPLNFGSRYTFKIDSTAQSQVGYRIDAPFTANFVAGGLNPLPAVQAVGLESQGCSTTYPGSGSASGGDWTLGSCFWDNSLPLLSSGSYRFRGGDDGSGAIGSSNACADVNTDNFRIIFNNYMNTGNTVNAVRMQRVSPPSSNIRTATYLWSDCQSAFPFGCKVLTITFAEQESSCNGTLFGDSSTGGDFNLDRTDNAPANFPFYQLIVDTSAQDVNGKNLSSQFIFGVEGK